ncbi:MAG: hypothetical protein R3B96_10345 [Pirellulaceae bacterium]
MSGSKRGREWELGVAGDSPQGQSFLAGPSPAVAWPGFHLHWPNELELILL